jgi:galacturan 1,4-alpha-galacturonidase
MRLYSPLNTAIIASLFFVSSLAVLLTNNTCTVLANGFEVVDDSPTINDAIMKCGNGGSIVLPAGQYYSIHNSIDFSPCKSCDFQIEGTIIVAREQLNYFANYNRSVFTIANATGVRIRSVTGTGTVDGNGVDCKCILEELSGCSLTAHVHLS